MSKSTSSQQLVRPNEICPIEVQTDHKLKMLLKENSFSQNWQTNMKGEKISFRKFQYWVDKSVAVHQ
jgi:hypothetical protein